MSSIKVSALTAKTTPSGSEELLINDSGVSKKITIANLPDTDTVYTHPNHSGDVTSTADGATVIGTGKVLTSMILDDNVTADKLANSINTDIAKGPAALPKAGGALTGAVTTNSTFDGRDVATDGSKLDLIEALADVTDTANVTAAGALMDSELASIAAVKATTGTFLAADETKLDGIATSANNYTHPTTAGNKHIPTAGAAGQFLKYSASGTAVWAADNNTVYTHPTGAGYNHIPTGGTVGQILKNTASGTATWQADNTVCTSGTATTAATLATARTIAGVSFNGSANISLNNNAITNGAGYTTNVGDITGVTAGTGMSGGGTSGTVTLTCTIDSPSEVGLGNLSSSGNALSGDFTATGNITAYSDLRLKSNIEVIDDSLAKVMSLRGVNFDMNGERSTGVIAQELEVVLPEAVRDNEDGMKSVAYGNIVGLLIEAIKEQQKQINELRG